MDQKLGQKKKRQAQVEKRNDCQDIDGVLFPFHNQIIFDLLSLSLMPRLVYACYEFLLHYGGRRLEGVNPHVSS
jgi:hypothetical protein